MIQEKLDAGGTVVGTGAYNEGVACLTALKGKMRVVSLKGIGSPYPRLRSYAHVGLIL